MGGRVVLCLIAVLLLAVTATAVKKVRREVAASHEHWETMVRRSVANWPTHRRRYPLDYEPEIPNMQEYYRSVLQDDYWTDTADEKSYRYQASTQVTRQDKQKAIRGRYIVMFTAGASDHHLDRTVAILRQADQKSRRNKWDLRAADFTAIRHVGKGFSATLSANIVRILWKNPMVYSIEQDVALKRNSHHDYPPPLVQSADASLPWNLDRIDQRSSDLDGTYRPEATGEGVDIYILDTGIRYSHHDFEGRAHYGGYDAIDLLTGSEERGKDCNGHGTHCAGTAAGKHYGVAKKASLYSVRVLGCSGTGAVSGIIHALDFLMNKVRAGTRKAVISMSLGVHSHESFNTAVDNVVRSGIVIVAASGNQGKDSCGISPGNAPGSISVAATDRSDESAFFSNIGKCVDVFAPGIGIESAGFKCDTCKAIKSGTSMACPHVAGFSAILLSIDNTLTPLQVKKKIIGYATKKAVSFSTESSHALVMSTPNRLLYVPHPGETKM